MQRQTIVTQVQKAIHDVDPTATVILYGSEARGDARQDSDIDILILLEGEKCDLKRERTFTRPLNDIEWNTGVLISPMIMLRKQWENRPFETPFSINVRNEGVRL